MLNLFMYKRAYSTTLASNSLATVKLTKKYYDPAW